MHRHDILMKQRLKTSIILLNWLSNVCASDAVRRAVGKILTDVGSEWLVSILCDKLVDEALEVDTDVLSGTSWLSLMMRVDGVNRLPHDLQTPLHDLYFNLIKDTVFKQKFFQCFVMHYERFTHAQLNQLYKDNCDGVMDSNSKGGPDIAQSFSVQLFTVPALVQLMVQEGALLDVMLRVLLNLFEIVSVPIQCDTSVPYEESAFAAKYPQARKALKTASSKTAASQESTAEASSSTGRHCASNSASVCADISESGGNTPTSSPLTRPGVINVLANLDIEQHNADNADNTEDRNNGEGYADAGDGRLVIDVNIEDGETAEVQMNEIALAAGRDIGINNNINNDDVQVNEDGGIEMEADNETLVIINNHIALEEELDFPADVEHFTTLNLLLQFGNDDDGENEDDEDDADNHVELNPTNTRLFARRRDLHHSHPQWKEQVKAFEDGLYFKPCSFNRIAKDDIPDSKFLKALRQARATESAALDGNDQLSHQLRLDWLSLEKLNIDKIILRVMLDLGYVFNHEAAAFHFLHVRPRPFRMLLRIMSMMQGMIPYRRRFGDHAPTMSNDWSRAFRLETEIYRLFDLIGGALCARSARRFSDVFGHAVVAAEMDMGMSRRKIIRLIRSCLDEWLFREQAIEALKTCVGEEYTVAHGLSIYLPLHRLLALCVHHTVRIDGVDVSTALGLESRGSARETEVAKRLLLHPIRLQSFFAQVRAGMWKRNGQPVAGQSYMYAKLENSEWYVELDLFLQQCCAVVMGPDAFIREVMQIFRVNDLVEVIDLMGCGPGDKSKSGSNSRRHELQRLMARATAERIVEEAMFGVGAEPPRNVEEPPGAIARENQVVTDEIQDSNRASASSSAVAADANEECTFGLLPLVPQYLIKKGLISGIDLVPNMGNTKSELATYMQTIVEEMLVLIVRVATDRARCGQSKIELMRSRIIHELAAGDKVYSALKVRCSFIAVNNDTKAVNEEAERLGEQDGEDEILTEASIESVLSELADFIPPKGMKPGTYRLKDKFWVEFDPFCAHILCRERCSAEIRHATVSKRNKLYDVQTILMGKVRDKPLFESFERLNLIAAAACGQGEEALSTIILGKFGPKEGDSGYWAGLLAAVSQLLCMHVESPTEALTEWMCAIAGSKDEFKLSAIGGLCNFASEMQMSNSALYGDFKPVVKRIIRQIYDVGGKEMKAILVDTIPGALPDELVPKENTNASGAEGEEPLSPEEKRRRFLQKKKKEQQAASMRRMQQAQMKFALSIEAASEAESIGKDLKDREGKEIKTNGKTDPSLKEGVAADGDGTGTKTEQVDAVDYEREEQCVLCHSLGHEEGKDGLIGMIGFQQKTRIPIIAQRTCNSLPRVGHKFPGRLGRFVDTVSDDQMITEPDSEPQNIPGPSNSGWDDVRDSIMPDVRMENIDAADTNSTVTGPSDSPAVPPVAEARTSSEGNLVSSMNKEVLKHGFENGRTVHVALCGHAVHVDCFDGFFNSLLRSRSRQLVFAGSEVVDLEKYEFLCPGCRRLSNLILPTVDHSRMSLNGGFDSSDRNNSGNLLSYTSWVERVSKMIEDDESDATKKSNNVTGSGSMGYNIRAISKTFCRQTNESDLFKDVDNGSVNVPKNGLVRKVIELMKSFRFAGKKDWEYYDYDDIQESANDIGKMAMNELAAWFSQCVMTTVGCVEIGARGVEWSDTLLQQARKSVRMFVQICRDLVGLDDEGRERTLRVIWASILELSGQNGQIVKDTGMNKKRRKNSSTSASGAMKEGRQDAFVSICVLMLVWGGKLRWEDVKMMVRLGLEIVLREHGDNVTEACERQELLLKVILFCRRSVVMCGAVLEGGIEEVETVHGLCVRLRTYGRKSDLASAKEEALELMQLFDIDMDVLRKVIEGIVVPGNGTMNKVGGNVMKVGFLPIKIGLVDLDREYASLLGEVEEGRNQKCEVCASSSKAKVICLVCGSFICRGSKCGVQQIEPGDRRDVGQGRGARPERIARVDRVVEAEGLIGGLRGGRGHGGRVRVGIRGRGGTRTRGIGHGDRGRGRGRGRVRGRGRGRGGVQQTVPGGRRRGGAAGGADSDGDDNDSMNEDDEDVDGAGTWGRGRMDGVEVHTVECGGGVGVALSEHMDCATVEIRRWRRQTEWGSLYLDVHGECDDMLNKGKALFLCESRYETLEKLWVLHAFDQDCYILNHGLRRRHFL